MSYEASISRIRPCMRMRLAALFSGGKDSTRAMHAAQESGHHIACLISMIPVSAESHLLHHPNMRWTRLQAESMGIPLRMVYSLSDDTDDELGALGRAIGDARNEFRIGGIVHGGIKSGFQKRMFEEACSGLDMRQITPLWGIEPRKYMGTLLDLGYRFMISAVSSGGLDGSWLGRIMDRKGLDELFELADRHGFDPSLEGGEAETFVVDCPLFSHGITVTKSERTWDGYRGLLEIVDAELNTDA